MYKPLGSVFSCCFRCWNLWINVSTECGDDMMQRRMTRRFGILAVLTLVILFSWSLSLAPNIPAVFSSGCPFRTSTGMLCPGCGLKRAISALTRGELATAFRLNALGVILIFLLLSLLVAELVARVFHTPTPWRAYLLRWAPSIVIGSIVLFFILRNLA